MLGEQAAILGCWQDWRLQAAKSEGFSQPHHWSNSWTHQSKHQVNFNCCLTVVVIFIQFPAFNSPSASLLWVVSRWTGWTCTGRSTSPSRGSSTSPRPAGFKSGCKNTCLLEVLVAPKTVINSTTWIYVMPSVYHVKKCIYCPNITITCSDL